MKKTLPDQAEINKIAKTFIKLRNKLGRSDTEENRKEFADYKNYVADRLTHLVTMKSNRYRNFPNHSDLVQEGYEALFLALKSYSPKKGDFCWWSRKYIDTRISRAANAHSTVRYPIKKAGLIKPYKVKNIPVIQDTAQTAFETCESHEYKILIKEAITKLDEKYREVILWAYGFKNNSNTSIAFVCKQLGMSRPTLSKLLRIAENKLREIILDGENGRNTV